jgi:excisionase family DNA binding protein
MTIIEQLRTLACLLSAKEVARILKVHQETVYILIRDEGLPSIRIGRSHRFDGALLARWIERRST